jgi:hypothetical protein
MVECNLLAALPLDGEVAAPKILLTGFRQSTD